MKASSFIYPGTGFKSAPGGEMEKNEIELKYKNVFFLF